MTLDSGWIQAVVGILVMMGMSVSFVVSWRSAQKELRVGQRTLTEELAKLTSTLDRLTHAAHELQSASRVLTVELQYLKDQSNKFELKLENVSQKVESMRDPVHWVRNQMMTIKRDDK